jgi:hypothetical protein
MSVCGAVSPLRLIDPLSCCDPALKSLAAPTTAAQSKCLMTHLDSDSVVRAGRELLFSLGGIGLLIVMEVFVLTIA